MNINLSEQQHHIVDQLFKNFSLETIPDAIIAVDTRHIVVYMNTAAEILYGWTKEEAIGRRESELMKTRLIGITTEEYRRTIRSKGLWVGETIQQTKSGRRVFISSTATLIKNSRDSQIGTVSVNRDITEHKQVEYNLRFLSAAAKTFSSSLDFKTILNQVAQLAVPRIADWCTIELLNEKGELDAAAIAHRDPKKVKWAYELRTKFKTNMHADTGVPKVIKTGKAEFFPFIPDSVLAAAAESPRQLSLLRKLGMTSIIIVPIMGDHTAVGAITLVATESHRHYTEIDLEMAEKLASRASLAIQNAKLFQNAEREIRERRQAEERLRDSENRLDVILKSVADGITMQSPEGDIVYANDIAARATGFSSASEMMATSPEELQKRLSHFEMRDEFGKTLTIHELPGRIAMRGKEEMYEKRIEFKNIHTGEVRWSLVKARAVRNSAGKIIYTVNIISDITEREELEKRKDNFISMASHELKTPITTLKIYTDLLSKQLEENHDARFQKPLHMMKGQIDKLGTLIADLLNLSKIQSGKLEFRMQEFQIDTLVCDICEQLQPSLHHKIKLSGFTTKKVCGDPERIGQVLINLITNAAKYSPHAHEIKIKIAENSEYVKISIQDFGIGIDKSHRQKIFERFYQISTSEKTFPGLGMGLYISQEIITRHKGNLWVESKKGKGSTFSFTLPFSTLTPEPKKTTVNSKKRKASEKVS